MGYYKPCEELDKCRALGIYWENKEFEKWTSGYLKIAKETGYPLAECQVGYAYSEGIGVEKDLAKALYWTKRAAEDGDRDGQYNLACCYEHGTGTDMDLEKALYWYEKAASQDHDLAIKKCEELKHSKGRTHE